MDERREVTAVVEQEVRSLATLECAKLLMDAPVVLLLGLPLPGENGDTRRGNGSGGMVLRRKDVAARPGDLRTQLDQGLDQNCGLDGHMKASRNACSGKRLLGAVLLAKRHQTRHFVLGDRDLLPTPVGQ